MVILLLYLQAESSCKAKTGFILLSFLVYCPAPNKLNKCWWSEWRPGKGPLPVPAGDTPASVPEMTRCTDPRGRHHPAGIPPCCSFQEAVKSSLPQVSEIQLASIFKCKICKAWLLVEKTGAVRFHFLGDRDPWIWRWWALLTAWNGSSSLTLRSQLKRKQLVWLVLLKSCGLQPLELGLFIHLNWILAFTCVCSLHKDLFIWVLESCLLLSTCGRKKWLDWRC